MLGLPAAGMGHPYLTANQLHR